MKMGNYFNFKLFVSFSLITLCLIDAFVFPDYDPPIIEPSVKEQSVSVGGNLTLECSGKLPVTWKLPIINTSEDDDFGNPMNQLSTFYDSSFEYPYKVLLEVFYVSVINVGFYFCHFNTTTNDTNIDDLKEMEQNGQASSVYVYVEDPERLFVPIDNLIVQDQHSPVEIPCRPSSPNVHVELYKDNVQIPTNRRVKSMNDRIITFDKRIGFIIPDAKTDDGSYYTCVYEKNGINSTSDFHLQITIRSYSISPPLFNDLENDLHSEIDGTIKLNCSFLLTKGVPVYIYWKYPVENSISDKSRIFISNTTTFYSPSGKVAQSLFFVSNVTQDDQGTYTCGVVDNSRNEAEKSQFITVHEKGYSFVNLSSDNLVLKPKKRPNSPFSSQCMTVKIKAYPKPTVTWYNNQGREIDFQSNKYTHILTGRTKSIMCINNIEVQDTGIYGVEVSTLKETASLNFTLNVEVQPNAVLNGQMFNMVNKTSRIKCVILSNPEPKVQWFFKECDTDDECLTARRITIKDVYIEPLAKMENFSYLSIVRYQAVKNGQLICQAKNSLGSSNDTSRFFVTDIEDGFGISGYSEPIAVGDNLTLICGASKFVDYSGVIKWYKMPQRTLITSDKNKGYIITNGSSDYSYQLIMSIPSVDKSFSGKYSCGVEKITKDGSIETEEQHIELDVKDEIKPIIVSTNLNNSDFKLLLGMPKIHFYCMATGIPYPKIEWFKDDVLLRPDGKDQRIRIVNNNTRVEIDYIKEEDVGVFRCSAVNRVGTMTRFINIKLNHQQINIIYIVAIAVLALIFLILIIYLAWKVRKERKIRKELSLVGLLHFEKGATESLNPELGLDEQAELLPYDKKWEFPREKLKLGKQLGSGAFGVVMKGTAYGILENEESTTVAVKMVKKTADATFIKALASELKIMIHLGKHLNVVNLLGACTKNVSKRELYVIVEYCRFGNLHNYLLRHRDIFIDQIDPVKDSIDPNIGSDIINRAYSISSNHSVTKYNFAPISNSDENRDSGFGPSSSVFDTANTVISMVPNGEQNEGMVTSNGSIQPGWRSNYKGDYNYNKEAKPISTTDLLAWSFQVARGMEYLANRKVLHGDLAARNILLADDNIVKICDFGLAKSMYKDDNYKKKGDGPLPVKWMAIESIRDRVFSTQSDVWSYGIVLWELFSLARTPYPGMDADEKFYNKLVEGYRMEKPKFANKQIYNTMLECWRGRPIQRPSFTELASRLGNLLEDSVRNHYIDLNDPYMVMNSRWMEESGKNDYLAMMSAPDYRNISSSNENHEYVNDPFGGPTKVNPLSPDETDSDGYLCMSPAKSSIISTDDNVFNFPTVPHKLTKSQLKNDINFEKFEMVPILKMGRLNSDGSTPSTPKFILGNTHPPTISSFLNPAYQTNIFQAKGVEQGNNLGNYVNMSQKDSGFCDDPEGSPKSFSNPSYVTMNGNIVNNNKSEMAVA